MNEMVNNFLMGGDKFMPEMHIKQHLDLLIVLAVHLIKTKTQFKNLCRQER